MIKNGTKDPRGINRKQKFLRKLRDLRFVNETESVFLAGEVPFSGLLMAGRVGVKSDRHVDGMN